MESLKERKKLFLKILLHAQKTYGKSGKRLAGEGWGKDYQLLFATMMSAQTRDETTIPVAESLYKKYSSLQIISEAPLDDIQETIKRVNYHKTKAKNIKASARMLVSSFDGLVPKNISGLLELPGVGRKTANLVLGELYKTDAICVDTHVHRISNVLGLVETRTPFETERELMKIAPKKYWREINRLFVLWGKEVPGRDEEKLLRRIGLQ